MSGPDLLERTRMALAEVGYDPLLATEGPRKVVVIDGSVSMLDAWRAVSIARMSQDRQSCFACRSMIPTNADMETLLATSAGCRADRPLVRDCGVTR